MRCLPSMHHSSPACVMWMVSLFIHMGLATWAAAAPATLAQRGQAKMSIILSDNASQATQTAAAELAQYLGRITGSPFTITTGDGSKGLVVGTPQEWPDLALAQSLVPHDRTHLEDYLLQSHDQGVYLLGAGDNGVSNAVWDFLHRLGYRQYFPGPTWEVIPHTGDLVIDIDDRLSPDYLYRRIWYGGGTTRARRDATRHWVTRNRAGGAFHAGSGHAYHTIREAHAAEFEAHPEYRGLVDGERKGNKFCISNPGLRDLVVRYTLNTARANPDAFVISLEPSDGGNWCECEPCAQLGSISDRVVTLNNQAAQALVDAGLPQYVSMYVYGQHSPPPAVKVHPRVMGNVATSFIREGYTFEELLQGWHDQGMTLLGIRDYASIYPWDKSMPGKPRLSSLERLRKHLVRCGELGVRLASCESSDNWGPMGLSYYIASRIYFDVREADRVDQLVQDFLDRAFESASQPMAEFYGYMNGPTTPPLSEDFLGRLYRCLDQAYQMTSEPAVIARLDELTLYVRFVEMKFKAADDSAITDLALLTHACKMAHTGMMHFKKFMEDYDRDLQSTAWSAAQDSLYSRQDILAMVDAGVASNPLFTFTPVTFSDELVPAPKLAQSDVKRGDFGKFTRGTVTWYTFVPKAPASLSYEVTGGLIRHYRDRGDATLTLFSAAEVEGKPLFEAASAPDGVTRTVTLRTPDTGLHWITVRDGNDATRTDWPATTPMTRPASAELPARITHGRGRLCFYVPKGTTTVAGFLRGVADVTDNQANVITRLELKGAYFDIPVPPGKDGQLWWLDDTRGRFFFLTVPPWCARSGQELLLPAEVVERDGLSQ